MVEQAVAAEAQARAALDTASIDPRVHLENIEASCVMAPPIHV